MEESSVPWMARRRVRMTQMVDTARFRKGSVCTVLQLSSSCQVVLNSTKETGDHTLVGLVLYFVCRSCYSLLQRGLLGTSHPEFASRTHHFLLETTGGQRPFNSRRPNSNSSPCLSFCSLMSERSRHCPWDLPELRSQGLDDISTPPSEGIYTIWGGSLFLQTG